MNSLTMALAVQDKVRSRFRGQRNMLPRVQMYHPINLEREYERVVSAYMRMLNKTIAKQLPTVRKAISASTGASWRDDAIEDLFDSFQGNSIEDIISTTFSCIKATFESQARTFGLERRLARLANQTRRISIAEWRRLVQSALGINIMEDYYMGEFFSSMLAQWVTTNVGLITSVPQTCLAELQNIITRGWQSSLSNRDISKKIQQAYDMSKKKAQFWARDQMASLNADMTQQQQADAGVQEYIWSTSGDERVRGNPSGKWPKGDHYQLDGTRHRWDTPPIVDKRTGRRAHPGKDYNCRCVALPVFNLPGLSLPWEGGIAA